MLRNQDPLIQPNGNGHFITFDGVAEPMLTSSTQSDDLSEHHNEENNNLLSAISLYLSQHLHRD